jgi:hypothetical protein
MKVRGRSHLGCYHALIREPGRRTRRSKAERRFCKECGSALWLWDPTWPELIHPARLGDRHAVAEARRKSSRRRSRMPRPWVDVPRGKGHVRHRNWPEESLEDWHKRHRLWSP